MLEQELHQRAQEECRALSQAMHVSLPQELCDMVYQYLYLEDATIPLGLHHSPVPTSYRISNPGGLETKFLQITLANGRVLEDHSISPPRGIILPDNYALQPAYMDEGFYSTHRGLDNSVANAIHGKDITHLVNENYFKNNKFSICAVYHSIQNLLLQRPDNTNSDDNNCQNLTPPPAWHNTPTLTPLSHISQLELRIKAEHFNHDYRRFTGDASSERDFMHDIYHNVLPLTRWMRKDGPSEHLELDIIIMTDLYANSRSSVCKIQRCYTNILEAVRDMVYTGMHHPRISVRAQHFDDIISAFPQNITKVFNLTKEQWEYEIATRGGKENMDSAPFFIPPLDSSDLVGEIEDKSSPWERPAFPAGGAEKYYYEIPDDLFKHMLRERWGLPSAFCRAAISSVRQGRWWPRRPESLGEEFN